MQDALILTVRDFLKAHIAPGQPILVGFSGGPDSKALVHALIECKRFFSLDIHVAHIDHSWREESAQEALMLKDSIESLGLKFHLKTLRAEDFAEGNKENKARDLRHQFFKTIYDQIDAQALLVAHHMDDLAETVLKRIFEGAGIFSWSCMQPAGLISGMNVWRPLLSLPKKEILRWLDFKRLSYIVDRTNLDSSYLRGRMRTSIFPYLEDQFGKNIVSSLCSLSDDAAKITKPIIESFNSLSIKAKDCLLGTYICLADLKELTPEHIPLFLRFFLSERGVLASKTIIRDLAEAIKGSNEPKHFQTGEWSLYVDRQRLFLVNELPKFSLNIPVEEGTWRDGRWLYEVSWQKCIVPGRSSSWEDAFDGHFFVDLPQKGCHLVSLGSIKDKSLKDFLLKRFGSSKVPSFLRLLFPFVIHNDELIHEFLTGKNLKKCPTDIPKRLSIRLLRDRK